MRVPYYILFSPYHFATHQFKPPFLRIFKYLEVDDLYQEITIRNIANIEGSSGIYEEYLFDLSPRIPVLIGLKKLFEVHENGSARFRLVFIDPETKSVLLTKSEKYLELLKKNKIEF